MSTDIKRRKVVSMIARFGLSLPAYWITPVIEIATIPQMGTMSGVVTVSDVKLIFFGELNNCTTEYEGIKYVGSLSFIAFRYSDPSGGIKPGAKVLFSTSYRTTIESEMDVGELLLVEGNKYSGILAIIFICIHFGSRASMDFSIQLVNVAGMFSNKESVVVHRPPGAQSVEGEGGIFWQ